MLSVVNAGVLAQETVAGLAPCAYKFQPSRLTMKDAEKACQAQGLELAVILDAEDNAAALTATGGAASQVWIGSHDQDTEGMWTWLPNNIPATWTNWAPGEPNSYNGNELEDCTVMRGWDGTWNDIPCDNEFQSICENADQCPKYFPTPPPPSPPVPPPVTTDGSAEVYDDPHVKTLSGNRYFMHGIGAFPYATTKDGDLRAQVYLCPFAPCNEKMSSNGECLTYIQAIAIQVKSEGTPHTIIFNGDSMLVDGVEQKSQPTVKLGSALIKSTGDAQATAPRARVDHESLADCHRPEVADKGLPTDGVTYKNCTTVEWQIVTDQMTLDVGVVGPFESGWIKEAAGDRTFNIGVSHVTEDIGDVMGIVNGDQNGFFTPAPEFKYEKTADGSLQPEHPDAEEVTGDNINPQYLLFPKELQERLNTQCGSAQALTLLSESAARHDLIKKMRAGLASGNSTKVADLGSSP